MSRIFTKELKTATEEVCSRPWSGSKNGLRFRCHLCGHKFTPGDKYRFVYSNFEGSPTRTGNFCVCEACNDDDDVLRAKRAEAEDEGFRRFWWLVHDDNYLARWTDE